MNPAEDDELQALVEVLKRTIFKDFEKKLPCIVKEVSADRTRVKVQPLIMKVDNEGNQISRNDIVSIPVFNAGAGAIVISFPIAAGDIGWIESNDRDLSIFLQEYSESIPGSKRMHSFSDAIFVPDIMHDFSINTEDSGAVVIQTTDGNVRIALDATAIRLTNATTKTVMTASSVSTVCGTTTFATNGSNYSVQTPSGVVTINGLTVQPNGDWATTSGATSVGGDVSSSTGVTLNTHLHPVPGVTTGASTVISSVSTGA